MKIKWDLFTQIERSANFRDNLIKMDKIEIMKTFGISLSDTNKCINYAILLEYKNAKK
jgi:hypothetical protein